MLIAIPTHAGPSVWEGPMEREAAQQSRGRLDGRDLPRDLPVASIGRPEAWPLADVYDPGRMPAPLRAKLDEADFHVVRFACSFRPVDASGSRQRITWARFSVDLLPDAGGVTPIAFDLYPLAIERASTRSRTLTFSPSLKFEAVEVSAGEVAFGVEYPQQEAVVSASGAGESTANWDYTALKGLQIHGVQWMYAVIKSPRRFGPLRATLDLAADLAVGNTVLRLLGIGDPERSRSQLTVALTS